LRLDPVDRVRADKLAAAAREETGWRKIGRSTILEQAVKIGLDELEARRAGKKKRSAGAR
jgi:hypothetical protein